jgi:hypothetical protein
MGQAARMTALLTACAALAVALVAVAQGGQQDQYPPEGHKVTICHGTASEQNPYELITVDESALEGHFGHDGPGGESGHGKNSNPDVFPDADGNCPDESGGGDT